MDIDVDLQKSVDKSNLLSSKPVSSSRPDSCSHLIHVLLDTFSTGEFLGQLKIRTILSSSKELNTYDWPSIFHRKKSNDLALTFSQDSTNKHTRVYYIPTVYKKCSFDPSLLAYVVAERQDLQSDDC